MYTVQCRCLYLAAPHGRSEIFLECSPKLCKLLALQCVNCAAVKYDLTLQSPISQHSLQWKEGRNSPKAETCTVNTGILHLTQITAGLKLQYLH